MSLGAFTSAISNGLARKNRYRVMLSGNGPTKAGGFDTHMALMCESIEFPGQNLMSEPDILRNGPPRESVTQATYGSVNATFIYSSDMREKRYFEISKTIYKDLDERLEQSKFLAGEKYSIADIATWPWIARHEWHDVGLKNYKNLSRWYLEIADREAVIKGYDFMKKGETIPKP